MARTETTKTPKTAPKTAPKAPKAAAPKRRKATTAGSTAARAAATAAAADTAPAPVEGVGCWYILPTERDAVAAASVELARLAPVAGRPDGTILGKTKPEWVTVAGLPQGRRPGVCLDGAIGAIARRAVADVVSHAVPVAVPVYWKAAPDGAPFERPGHLDHPGHGWDLDNPHHLTVNPEEAAAEPRAIGYLPASSLPAVAVAAVAGGLGLNVKGQSCSNAVAAIGRWAARWPTESALPKGLKGSGARRETAIRHHAATDKAGKAAYRDAVGESKAVNSIARAVTKYGAGVVDEALERVDGERVKRPGKRPVSV